MEKSSMGNLTRREFLMATGALVGAAALAGEGPFISRSANLAWAEGGQGKIPVAVVHRRWIPGARGDESDVLEYRKESVDAIAEMVREAFRLSVGGVEQVIKPGQKVFIKANGFVAGTVGSYGCVDPRTLEAVVRVIKEAVPSSYVMVGDTAALGYVLGGSRVTFERNRLTEASLRGGANEVVPLDETRRIVLDVPDGKAMHNAETYQVLKDADVLIDLAKMKTHIQGVVTMALKNWNGVVYYTQARPYGYDRTSMQGAHRADLHQKMVDLHKVLPPHFSLIDAIIGMEGQGPGGGTRKDMNLILASRDPVAVDAVGAAIMGIDPFEVPMLRIAQAEKVGVADLSRIEVRGARIEDVRSPFKRAVGDPFGVVPGLDVYAAGACQGCLAHIRGTLDGFLASGMKIKNAALITGWNTLPPERDYDLILLIGDCWETGPTAAAIKDYVRDMKAKGKEVVEHHGCAPLNLYVEMSKTLQDFAKKTV